MIDDRIRRIQRWIGAPETGDLNAPETVTELERDIVGLEKYLAAKTIVATPPEIEPQENLEHQNGWLVGAIKEPIPGGSAMLTRRALVIHFTAGASARSSIDYWRQLGSGICAHLVIDRDGTIYQCRAFDRTAGHAGRSKWQDPKTGTTYRNINSCTIGIELANAGDSVAVIDWARRNHDGTETMRARHRNGGPEVVWERYPQAQLDACFGVARSLVTAYNLDDVTGHDCVSPDRKNDPGPAFPMEDLREHCGFHGLPAVHY